MLDTHARKYITKPINKISKFMLSKKFTPLHITILALAIGLIPAVLILTTNLIYLPVIVLWISGLFDVVDGNMARISNQKTDFGGFCDIVFDRFVEISIILSLAYVYPKSSFTLLLLTASILISMTIFLTVGALVVNKKEKAFKYQTGLMERTEGFIFFTLMMIFRNHVSQISLVFVLFIGYTIIQRFREALILLKD
ncbi:MAG: CDP-alcohol phosphatidyltransferase family protein [Acidaminobacteraceae bacterium]